MKKGIILLCIILATLTTILYFGSVKKEVFAWPKSTESFILETDNGKNIEVEFDLIFSVVLLRRGDHIIQVRTEREYFAKENDNVYVKDLKNRFVAEEMKDTYNFDNISFSYKEKQDYLKYAVIVDTKDIRLDTINEKLLEYLGGFKNFKRGKYSFEKYKEDAVSIGLEYRE